MPPPALPAGAPPPFYGAPPSCQCGLPTVTTARSSLPAPLSPSTGATACPRYVNTVYQSHLVCFPRIYQFLVHPPSALLFHSPTVSLPVRPPFVYSHKRSRPTSPLLPLLRLPSHMHTPVTAMRPTSLIRVTSPTSVHFASLIPARFFYHSASRPPLSPSVVTIARLSPVQKDALK